jgi:hypothetical protein
VLGALMLSHGAVIAAMTVPAAMELMERKKFDA